jgi:hypothetical protein
VAGFHRVEGQIAARRSAFLFLGAVFRPVFLFRDAHVMLGIRHALTRFDVLA